MENSRTSEGRDAQPVPGGQATTQEEEAPVALVGREGERRRIEALLAEVRAQRSGALVLTGDPGIGKSTLCAWAVAQARDMRVMSRRAVESEADLPFAGLAELCAGELHRLPLLPAPQARALEVALSRRESARGDRFAIGAAVLSLLAVAGDRRPVLLVLDDAQWLDASSADALLFAARRLRGESVAMLIATRPRSVFDDQGAGLPCLALDGLDASTACALLAAAHGDLPAGVSRLLTDRTQGNPLALLEVPLVLEPAQLAGEQPIHDPLPLGPTLERALLRRVADLPRSTRRALLTAAASGTERIQPVVDALEGAGMGRDVVDTAEAAGVIVITSERFAFRHPLLRSAIYHGASAPARRDAHAALARVTSGATRAWHLAQATVGEDDAVAGELEQVGREARRRGAPAAAAAALERAARLSGPGEARVRRLTEAARDAHIAGRPTAALRLLEEALEDAPQGVQRADIQHLRGRIFVHQGRIAGVAGHGLLVDEAERVRELDPERAATMLAEACMGCFLSAEFGRALAVAREAWDVAVQAGPVVQAFTGVMLANALLLSGQRGEASALLDRHLPLLRDADPLSEAGQLMSAAAQCLFWLDRFEPACELLGRLTASARDAGAPGALLLPLCCRGELDLRLGRWDVAAAQFQEAASLGDEVAQSVIAAYASECLARLAAATGDEPGCLEHAARASSLIDRHENELGRLYVHSALGLLELGLGRSDAAISRLERARAHAQEHEVREPNVVHWQADLIEAYARAGRRPAALDALAAFEREAKATGGLWALGTAARCRALLTESGEEADAGFARALGHLEEISARFELARTHLCHGERLRRAGRRSLARAALGRALDEFDRLGAVPWAARARVELRATGATAVRRRAGADRDQLTAHELQVARIVAGGARTREAAAALFLSPKTIEFHLAQIYRKLGVRTRTELAGVAARRGWLDDAPNGRRSTAPQG